jgi:hypothetical protein
VNIVDGYIDEVRHEIERLMTDLKKRICLLRANKCGKAVVSHPLVCTALGRLRQLYQAHNRNAVAVKYEQSIFIRKVANNHEKSHSSSVC